MFAQGEGDTAKKIIAVRLERRDGHGSLKLLSRPVEVSGEQGADVLMLAMLAVESGRLGETVLVPPLAAADDGQAAEDDTRGSRLAAVDRPNG